MTDKEKAKAYDEAIEKLRSLHDDYDTISTLIDIKKELENIFPELKESENEQHRKWILKYLYDGLQKSDEQFKDQFEVAIAWFKKQGESIRIKKGKNYLCTKTHKYAGMKWIEGVKYYSPEDYSLVNQGCTCYCPKYSKEEHNNFFKEVEYDGCLEVDKVEPKFNVGDWIVNNDSGGVCQVTEIRDDEYCLWPLYAEIMGYLRIIDVDDEYHPWTIQDAKDGDVLVDKFSTNSIIILFKGINPRLSILAYCGYNGYNFSIKTDGLGYGCIDNTNYYPSTKEQRDLLFQKMKDAGYEWDSDKKELKKIEQKPVEWSDEDEENLQHCIGAIHAADYYTLEDKNEMEMWLKSLKQRMGG